MKPRGPNKLKDFRDVMNPIAHLFAEATITTRCK
jgi:hypothetical protein